MKKNVRTLGTPVQKTILFYLFNADTNTVMNMNSGTDIATGTASETTTDTDMAMNTGTTTDEDTDMVTNTETHHDIDTDTGVHGYICMDAAKENVYADSDTFKFMVTSHDHSLGRWT